MVLLRRLLSFFCLAFSQSLFSQHTITGTVADSTHAPIPYAVITLKAATDGNPAATQSDSSGTFSFTHINAGTYSITISHVGFGPCAITFDLRHDTAFAIQLVQSNESLKGVTITGSQALVERSADKVVYNVANSVTAAGSDALQAISQVPGVRVTNEEISVAGKGMVRVLINNRLLQLQGQDLTRYLKSVSANQITRIELITNPAARYEVEGNAGLINIITKHSKRQGYSGNVQLASKYYLPGVSPVYGVRSFGELSGSGNVAYNRNRWSAYASFNHVRDRHLEGFQFDLFYPKQHWLQTDTGLYTHNAYTALAGVDYKVSPSATIGASYSGGWDMYDGSDNVRNPVYNSSGAMDSLLRTYAHYHPIALPAALNLHGDFKLDTTGRLLSVNADYFNYYRNDISNFETNSFDALGNARPDSKTRIFDRNKQNIVIYTLKADFDWPTAVATYAFGGKLSYINEYSNAFYYDKTPTDALIYNTNLSNEFNYSENTQALYGNVSKDVNKWKLQAGIRGELTQTKGRSYTAQKTTINNYFRMFPSALIQYNANANHVLSLSAGRRINRPSFWNLNPFKSLFTAYSYGEGNPYLQPEYNSNLELAHAYKNVFRTSLFASKTEDGFVNVTIPDDNLVHTIPLNFIRTTRMGLSESVLFKPWSWWESNAFASVYHTKARSALSYVKSLEGTGAYLSTTNNFYFNRDKTVAAAVNFWYQFPEVDHIGKTHSYYKLDVGVKATTANKKWDLALNLNDALRSSALAYSYTVNDIPQTFTNFQIMRYLQLSVAYRFGGSAGAAPTRNAGNEDEKGRVH